MDSELRDDATTLTGLGVLAFILTDVVHEALGHGLAALLLGAKPVLLTTCYLSTAGTVSRWIPAAGGLANLALGGFALLFLRWSRLRVMRFRYFLVLVAAFNLFFATAYPAYSGIARFGDWAAVIDGLEPSWLWRLLLVVSALVGYLLTMVLVARAANPFCGSREPGSLQRLQRITLIPYLAALAAALLGGVPNPAGWKVIFTAAMPAAAASFGLTQLDHLPAATSPSLLVDHSPCILRSSAWIAAAIVALVIFVVVLGPGIRFR
jgi:hypothetical protein